MYEYYLIWHTSGISPESSKTISQTKTNATPAVLKATLAAFENEMLKEDLWSQLTDSQARSQLKEAWSAYISKHFTQSSAGPSANPSMVATPPGLPSGAGGGSAENIKWLYTQTSVLCSADASQ